MLSWATESLLVDGRAQSDVRQGVTLEVMGEGFSMGPLTTPMKEELAAASLHGIEVEWTTLGEYLELLERRGVAPNVASFVGSATVREHELGADDRPPTPDELERMQGLVRDAMREGALGLAAALVYAPAFYADTEELIALARHAGLYITHLRSEGNAFVEALEEFLTIVRRAGVRGEIYHLKASGKSNWHKLEDVIARVEDAQRSGLAITADMYTYTAGATGLDGAMPPWVQAGGFEAWRSRLQDDGIRARVESEMEAETDDWENMFRLAGPGEHPPARVQERGVAAADRQDAGGGCGRTRDHAGTRGDGPRRRGRHARRRRLLHDVRGQPAPRGCPALGELLLRLTGARGRGQLSSSSARIRAHTAASRGCLRSTSATRESCRSRRRSAG